MSITQKIALSLCLWAALCLLLVGPVNYELFGILMLIGLLITRELTSTYTRPETGSRIDIFIYIGLIFFAVVIMQRVLSILDIL